MQLVEGLHLGLGCHQLLDTCFVCTGVVAAVNESDVGFVVQCERPVDGRISTAHDQDPLVVEFTQLRDEIVNSLFRKLQALRYRAFSV